MAIHDLKEQIARLPEQPGVYLWRNQAGDTIYVGKARVLRDRVRSYLSAGSLSPRHAALLEEIVSVEVIVTDSVMEALALENNLIKQRAPKYNIRISSSPPPRRFPACWWRVALSVEGISMPDPSCRPNWLAERWGWLTDCSAFGLVMR